MLFEVMKVHDARFALGVAELLAEFPLQNQARLRLPGQRVFRGGIGDLTDAAFAVGGAHVDRAVRIDATELRRTADEPRRAGA